MAKKVFLLSYGVVFLLLVTSCTGAPQYKDYYVSIQGSDSSGTGTLAKPWRTIQYTLDHANYSGIGDTVQIHLEKGIYNENIVIDEDVVIVGAGASETVSTFGDPNIPVQNVSVIARQFNQIASGASTDAPVTVKNGAEVSLENLNVFGGGIRVEHSDFSTNNIIVYDTRGLYGIELYESSFSIGNSKILTSDIIPSDYGISIVGSAGYITDTHLGWRFDHTINIQPGIRQSRLIPTICRPRSMSTLWASPLRVLRDGMQMEFAFRVLRMSSSETPASFVVLVAGQLTAAKSTIVPTRASR